jgi:replicative DNA helicase
MAENFDKPKKRNKPTDPSKIVIGRVPPQNTDLEEIILGTILIDRYVIDIIASEFSENLFYKPQNQVIALAIINLYRKSTPIDLVTVTQELISNKELEMAGGAVYISSLTDKVGSSANIEYHLKILQEYALKRNLITVSSEILRASYDAEEDIFDVYSKAQTDLESSMKSVVNYKIEDGKAIHERLIKQYYKLLDSGEKSGVPTGFKRLDNVTNGFQKSDLIILAGRPSMGKTAVAISMLIYPSIEKKKAVAIFSLEMSKEQVMARIQSCVSEINVSKIVKKQLNFEEINLLAKKGVEISNAPIFIDDTANLSITELKGKCRKLVKEHGVELIVIDYLQLMRSGVKTNNREQEIAEISRGLKIIAKELNVPVIALAQLSRNVENRGGEKKPMLSDLRESGQIEQDADMVMFCYRPEYYGFTEYTIGNNSFEGNGLFVLVIAKHRNGELGEIPLKFINEQARVTNLDRDVYTTDNASGMSSAIRPPTEETNNSNSSSPFSPMELSELDDFNADFNNPKDNLPF